MPKGMLSARAHPEKRELDGRMTEADLKAEIARLSQLSPVDIGIGDIVLRPPFSNAFRLKDSTYENIKLSIAEKGYDRHFPVFLWKQDKVYSLFDGNRRFTASSELGLPTIPSIVFEHEFKNDNDVLRYLWDIQFGRRNLDDIGILDWLKNANLDLLPGPGKTRDKLASKLGCSAGKAQEFINIANSKREDLFTAIAEEKISIHQAAEIIKNNTTLDIATHNFSATEEQQVHPNESKPQSERTASPEGEGGAPTALKSSPSTDNSKQASQDKARTPAIDIALLRAQLKDANAENKKIKSGLLKIDNRLKAKISSLSNQEESAKNKDSIRTKLSLWSEFQTLLNPVVQLIEPQEKEQP